ncbi:SGNH hydrolase-type esterase domain-containing protein [Dactylonectria estremocensis]|uniref:SGNH hydrolase-type esterase domain-containing protein n=1 Tax=Dactylonectria estremocensis TaxID=1079267 RepID=A0A9P9E0Y2_9HYPO|nr:SGNH hydrolase-type esterase domain-containing protein [Dactylonectria estremocensis]
MWRQICIASLLGQAMAIPAHWAGSEEMRGLAATRVARLLPRQTDVVEENLFDASDFSWINKIAAIGDSYSAGIGAGDRLGGISDALDPTSDWACSRYTGSYPYLVSNDERLGDAANRNFQFKSCSGAVSKDVLEQQIPALDADQQVILLSIGGNDVELVNILNQCIFQWAVVNQEQVAVAKLAALDKNYDWTRDFDWDKLGRGCAGQLDLTQALIDSEGFSSNLDAVLAAAKGKLAQDGIIYTTGYGKFFGEDLSPECDSVSWSTWIYKAWNMFQPQAMLTADNRRRMNELVDAVNAKLVITILQHIADPNLRTRLMFYELNTWDPLGNTPWKRTNDDPLNGTFSGAVDIFAEITLLVDPDAQLTHKDNVDDDNTAVEILNDAEMKVTAAESDNVQVPNLLPDGYGRVFHPQMLLHEIIANRVLHEMASDNQQRNGGPEIPEVLSMTVCDYTAPFPTLPPATTAAPGTVIPIETPDGSSCESTATKEICTVPGNPCATSVGLLTCFKDLDLLGIVAVLRELGCNSSAPASRADTGPAGAVI